MSKRAPAETSGDDDRPTPQEILEQNRSHGNDNEPSESYQRDCSSEDARDLISEWVATHVDQHRIASSNQIHSESDRDDVRIQDIGRTLGSRRAGMTPDGFLEEVEVSTWRDKRPRKWVFDRVAGEKRETPRSTTLYRHQLIDEITAALDADVADEVHEDSRGNSKKINCGWMRAVVTAIASRRGESIESFVTGYDPDSWRTKSQYIDSLGTIELSRLLERVLETDQELGTAHGWTRSTIRIIHAIIVEDTHPLEVDV